MRNFCVQNWYIINTIFLFRNKFISKKKNCINNTSYELKGTLVYCAPEILGKYKYSKAGDVYAFGLIPYEIITNEVPFQKIFFL